MHFMRNLTFLHRKLSIQVWWHKSVILALGRPPQKNVEFVAGLGYAVRPSQNQTKISKTKLNKNFSVGDRFP